MPALFSRQSQNFTLFKFCAILYIQRCSMNTISSLLTNNIQNSYESISPIENGYIPINARTLNTKNNDFYVDLKSQDKNENYDNYLETLKEQIEFSKRQTEENKEIRMKELMEESVGVVTEKMKNEALETYSRISNI